MVEACELESALPLVCGSRAILPLFLQIGHLWLLAISPPLSLTLLLLLLQAKGKITSKKKLRPE
jgi:hypothetical protein